ncbi:hypothetical protein IPJ70_03460 [Candidatus Campbellbacteria bacterium]|nr:MAG: hypothetical protein IPJ70_03460 [Candidatus Campbellbacteria bacterium]
MRENHMCEKFEVLKRAHSQGRQVRVHGPGTSSIVGHVTDIDEGTLSATVKGRYVELKFAGGEHANDLHVGFADA